jgi:2-polyprenyl-6-methoxyphenol hydroxylase-like FAD-dependent oxidoreductase
VIDVLVAGAGPVGLALGIQLARFGLSFRIVDKSERPTPLEESRALGVHSRTLEVFEDMGVIARALAEGMRWHGTNAYAGGQRILHVAFEELDAPYPFLLTLPQSRTERILEARLVELGARVERGRALVALEQNPDSVLARIADGSGKTEAIEARWLVGCDGCHSAVRHATDIAFEGAPYEERFVLADVTLEGDVARDESHAWFSHEGPFIILPLPGGKARLLAQVLGDPEVTLPFFRELIAERGPKPALVVRDASWLASFKIHHRLAARYRSGRCFIAGDAAHIHSPVGGQGMNTGIQDVYNLSWKLAQAARGGPDLLDSYEAERRPIAEAVLRDTDRATRFVTLRNPVAQEIRNRVVQFVGQLEVVQQRIFHQASELGLNYRKSPIVGGSAGFFASGPTPGDRAPDFELEDGRRFFSARNGLGHTLLAVGVEASALPGSSTVHVKSSPRYGAGFYLVRPDGYVGFRGNDEKALRAYAAKTLGVVAR